MRYMGQRPILSRLLCHIAVIALTMTGMVLSTAPDAAADTAPISIPDEPTTYAADALPTAQIDGVAWAQTIVGNTVYVAGSFATARPAGAAEGTSTVPRANLMAYDLTTGEITDWAPQTNGEVLTIEPSPDGKRLYLGGTFTTVNGVARKFIAAVSSTGVGTLVSAFAPRPNARVQAIAVTSTKVYFGGVFTAVGSSTRGRLAAWDLATKSLTSWAPAAKGGKVWSMALIPDQSRLIAGGAFTSVNGSSGKAGSSGYGLAMVNTSTGALVSMAASSVIANGGADAAITSVHIDGDSAYVSGYTFGSGGNLEGAARLNLDGSLVWLEDCHGDTYDTFAASTVLYVVGHPHYCGNVPGGFTQTDPLQYSRSLAFTTSVAGTLQPDYYGSGYTDFAGTAAPELLPFYPTLAAGTVTSTNQGPWAVTGTDDYLVMAGEFPTVNGVDQQGLVRFARTGLVADSDSLGPQIGGTGLEATAAANGAGSVAVTWRTSWDPDNRDLTYQVFRNGDLSAPVFTTTAASTPTDRPMLGFTDDSASGTARYRVVVSDPFGNEAATPATTNGVTVPTSGSPDAYTSAVVTDHPVNYWPLSESAGPTLTDYMGRGDLTGTGDLTYGASGAPSGTGVSFPGDSSVTAAATGSPTSWSASYTVEAWFRTTSADGGVIVSYSDRPESGSDRALYVDSGGRLSFRTLAASYARTLTSAGRVDDGEWHQAVGTVDETGTRLYLDGVRVAVRKDTRTGGTQVGVWRLGGEDVTGWANAPATGYLAGDTASVSTYYDGLSAEQVRAHFLAAGKTAADPQLPEDSYGEAVVAVGPLLYWRFDDSGTTARDASGNDLNGTYINDATAAGSGAIGLAEDQNLVTDGDTAEPGTSVTGHKQYVVSNDSLAGPTTFSTQIWFRTESTVGGKLIGFGSRDSGSSATFDRQLYLTDAGKLAFGINPSSGKSTVVSTASYNDGSWHQAVGTVGSDGQRLYVDGALVGKASATGGQAFTGYWRVGGDWLDGWPQKPTSYYLRGQLDEAAVYPTQLSATQVREQFQLGSGVQANTAPTAAFTTKASYTKASFDATASVDPDAGDSIASYSWDFGDGTTGTGSKPVHRYSSAGNFTVTLVVTDQHGSIADTSQKVAITQLLASDSFNRKLKAGWGAASTGGAWSPVAKRSRFSVGASTGRMAPPKGVALSASLAKVKAVESDTQVTLSLSKLPARGNASFAVASHVRGKSAYQARAVVNPRGKVTLQLVRVVKGKTTILRSKKLATTASLKPGKALDLVLETSGTGKSVLRAKAWRNGAAEPAGWQVSATDRTKVLQGAGAIGLWGATAKNATPLPVLRFDDLLATWRR
ncbi:MAG: PKD domain-containing protein [Nocardioidaceae bacterium]